MRKFLLILLSVILILPNFFSNNLFDEETYDGKEEYNPSHTYINTITKLELYTDSIVRTQKIEPGSFEHISAITHAVRNRFFHGFSHFTLSENWVASVAGKYIDEGLACKVQPAEIVQHSNAACSQQAIVMMAVLRDKKIPYRHLGFPHHYAMDVLIDGKWYFFDPDMEPVMTKAERCDTAWQYQSDNLKKYYSAEKAPNVNFVFGNGLMAQKGVINEVPASNARLFHSVTWAFSKMAWMVPLFFSFLYRFSKSTNNKRALQHVLTA